MHSTDDSVGCVEQVSSQVWRIELPLPLRDLRSVNAYVVSAGDGATIIDPGFATEESERVLLRSLAELGLTLQDISQILVTHLHWDHYSQALKFQREQGISVGLGRGEQDAIARASEQEFMYGDQAVLLARAGAESLAESVRYLEPESFERGIVIGPPDEWIDPGSQINCGSTYLVAHATPGHTQGHLVFEKPDDGLMFTGDHVLPRITPSIGFEPCPTPRALQTYLNSLRLLVDHGPRTMLPAHGALGGDVRIRAEELLEHHELRLNEIEALVTTQGCTAYDIARRMRWTRKLRSIEELSAVHAMSAVLEVEAHLWVLESHGRVYSDRSGPTHLYTAK